MTTEIVEQNRKNVPQLRRRYFLAAGLGIWVSRAGAEDSQFPNRAITLLVPWPAGGGTDLSLRVLAELVGAKLGQRVIVENRAGAGGTLAMAHLVRAPADGYTIAQMPQPVFRAPHLGNVTWNPLRDTTPIIQLAETTFGIAVSAQSPFKTLSELLDDARQKGKELSVATSGVATTPHVLMEQILRMNNIRYVHVPYKGVAEQMIAIANGQVNVGAGSTGLGAFVDSGKLRLLATTGARRAKRWPSVPTLKEIGIDFVIQSPYGLAAPAGISARAQSVLHDAFRSAMLEPAFAAELAKYDQEPSYLSAADYARVWREQFERERELVKRYELKAP
jgi:tripartite-type tricarboxylate transporter receptor subunit TctC